MNNATTLALLGGTPLGGVPRPNFPVFTDRAVARVRHLLETGDTVGLSKHHPVIREAETAIADWHGVPHCLGTSTGHAALQASLIGLEITGGDEVITTPYTWGATTAAILNNAAVPVFADVDPATGLLDPASVAAEITSKTMAILVVHMFGQPADMGALRALADRHDLALIEDGSHAHGARHHGQRVGSFGDAAGFSCMGAKILAATEAGYLVTRAADVYWKAAMSTQHMGGMRYDPGRVDEEGFPEPLRRFSDSLNYTYRLSTLNAALLVEQLPKLDAEVKARRANRAHLLELLDGAVRSVSFCSTPDHDEPSWYALSMSFEHEHAGVERDTYIAALRAEGLPVYRYVPSPISDWPRLDPDCTSPRVMWSDVIRRSGRKYSELPLPGCRQKIAKSIELDWHYVTPAPQAMEGVAAIFHKVEDNLPSLRRCERNGTLAPTAGISY